MPFLRVIRDKRGYETTYLLHWFREGNRQRSRILYVFRTPGGVRVGREPFAPEVLRQIEQQYPEIDFDWDVVRDNQQVVETPTEPRRRRPRREDESAVPTIAPVPDPAVATAAPPVAAPLPSASIPAALQGTTPDEQIAFLTDLYPMVRERVAARTSDPARLESLLALAERLNAATWTDADQITTGLQNAPEALERLSRVLAKRRRRPRRKGQRPAAASTQEPTSIDISDESDELEPPENEDEGADS